MPLLRALVTPTRFACGPTVISPHHFKYCFGVRPPLVLRVVRQIPWVTFLLAKKTDDHINPSPRPTTALRDYSSLGQIIDAYPRSLISGNMTYLDPANALEQFRGLRTSWEE